MWFIELGLRTYFILKHDRFLTIVIFTGSVSTVRNSLKIMFQNFTFRCYPGYDTCLSVLRIPFLEKGLISPAVRPQSSEFCRHVETSQNGGECVMRSVSLPHSVTCNRNKSVMLQKNKSEA